MTHIRTHLYVYWLLKDLSFTLVLLYISDYMDTEYCSSDHLLPISISKIYAFLYVYPLFFRTLSLNSKGFVNFLKTKTK